MKNYAYMTLASSSADYIKGVLCLQESLKRVGAKYPLIVLVTEDLAGSNDLQYVDNYKIIPYFTFKNITNRYEGTINKLQIFKENQYDKICFIDADVLVLKNIDYLFEKYEESDFTAKLYANIHR